MIGVIRLRIWRASTLLAFALAFLLIAGMGVLYAPAAQAAPGAIAQPTDVTADSLPTVQINGVVWKTIISGDVVYAGGEFTNARPAGAAPGTSLVTRSNLLAFNLRTGVLINSFAPTFNGKVKALALSPDGSRLYVGGAFTTVNGVTRNRMAAFTTATGALVTNFAPSFNSSVNAIQVTSSAVFAGGLFRRVGSTNRSSLAAIRPSDGALLSWAPVTDANVQALALTPDNSRLIVGGNFSLVNGAEAKGLASVQTADGSMVPFPLNQVVQDYGANQSILFLNMDPSGTVFGGGYAYGGTGAFFEGVFSADAYSGGVNWLADCHGDTYDSARVGQTVYSVSHHHDCTNMGSFPDTNPRKFWQYGNAFTLAATGTLNHNSQGGYFDFYGQPSPSQVNWFPTIVAGSFTGQTQGGWTLAGTSEYLVMGGEFPSINGTGQQGLARFAIPSIAPKQQGPRLTGTSFLPSLLAITPTKVRVKFPTNWDRDDLSLSYQVFREGLATPLYTTTANATFWNRPSLSYDDTTVQPGAAYRYRVRVTDPNGNLVTSSYVSITVPLTVSPYQTQVLTDAPSHYWRLGAPGNWADYSGNSDLASVGTVAADAAGAIGGDTDPATAFDGSTGTSGSSLLETGSNNLTVEAWFKTNSSSGGKIIGFGNGNSGLSGSYDRHVFMENSGRVTFGVYPGFPATLTSAASYNDGQWHHVAASLSGSGMKLFIDGMAAGQRSDVTSGQQYDGYWRVGGDNLNGWPNQPASNLLAGSIDEAAVYPTALTRDQIRSHYTSSGRTLNVTPLPTDAYAQAVNADAPMLFWRLGDTGSVATDSSGNQTVGTYYNGPAQGQSSPVAAGSATRFDGSDDGVGAAAAVTGPTTYSLEAWFATTSTSGGKIVGFGNAQSGNSSNYDRHVYLDPSGHLNFGAWTGQANIATSSGTYNDGAWHHVVATQGADGMRLIVDGDLDGTNGNTGAQDYTGYWRVGGDTSWSGNPFFAGLIDEVSVYDHVITLDQARNHYRASTADNNANPTADFTLDCVATTCQVNGGASTDSDGTIAGYAWTFGDTTTGTGQLASHAYSGPGTYLISLTVTDDAGGTATTSRSVTVRNAKPTPTDAYGISVSADQPLIYWRLDDSGPKAEDASPRTNDGTYFGGVTQGQASTVAGSNPAARFNGSDGGVGSDKQFAGPSVYTVESWIKTSSTSGGKVIGLGNAQSGLSTNYDRHVYLTPDGRINFGTWTGSEQLASSTRSYNDDAWHHVVAAQGAGGMRLYVDGELVGTNANEAAQDLTGYWRVGGDSAWGGAAPYLDGTIDEVAVYGQVLSQNQVRAHYRTSGADHNQAPTADFTASCTDASCSFTATAADADGSVSGYSWNFGEGPDGTGSSTSHAYTVSGSYTVRLTVTDDQGATTVVEHDVQVTVPVVNMPPTAGFTVTKADLKADFDASTSVDPDGTIQEYTWAFGDTTTGTGETTSHTYGAAGTYQVDLTVKDNSGATATKTIAVTVTAANVKPTAGFTATPTGLKVDVDGAASADSDGTVDSYAWDYGDGSTGTGKTDSHTYGVAGTYTVTLVVTDNNGAASGPVTKSVTVAAVPNVKPTAAFTATANGLKVDVDGSTSADSDGTVASYAWDYGDGATGTGRTDSHTYAGPGSYTITLVVTDDDGAASTAVTTSVTVSSVVVADNFNRNVTRWGNADTGGTWTYSNGGYFTTNGSAGVISLPKAGAQGTANLDSPSARDTTSTFILRLDTTATAAVQHTTVVRRNGTSDYRFTVTFGVDKSVRLNLTKRVNGTATSLGDVKVAGLTYNVGDTLNVKLAVTGSGTTSLQGKVWADGTAEPATAQIVRSDTTASLQVAGAYGIVDYLGGTATTIPVVLRLDDLRVVS